jgi:adenylyltransferase/sulfurtransferase
MSTTSIPPEDRFPEEWLRRKDEIKSLVIPGVAARHEAEADIFARHEGVPGHHQELLRDASVLMAGAGGLNGWTALGLLRSGVRCITIIDPDLVESTNLARQLFFEPDLGEPKTSRLMQNLAPHAVAGATMTGIQMRFEAAAEKFTLPVDLLIVGVDRNDCRHYAAQLARRMHIPAIFTMLSGDGMRCHCFYQGPYPADPCLWCALPNLDPEHILPCASAVITSCLLASAYTLFFAHRALMGWPEGTSPFNWREADLLGVAPDVIGRVSKRPDCPVCKDL